MPAFTCRSTLPAAAVLAFSAALARAADTVPAPAETPVEVTVSGRTSTLKRITVKPVGQAIPPTFSGTRLRNTPGYSWYVSRHYALKTDFPETRARHYLTLLELAYPHYLELFGREPPGMDKKRMAVVYGSSVPSLAKAMKSDGINWDFGGGGITFEDYNAAYQFPSGGLQYHLRYILLHECTHLFQVCLTGNVFATPGWYHEGVADLLANHVWEESRRRLTVNVVDKATANNFYDLGLRRYRRKPFSPRTVVTGEDSGREVGFVLTAYFSTDVERSLKFRIWRDEMFRLNLYRSFQERSESLVQDLFGPWARLEADFARWVKARRASFHYVEWGWEQDGDTLSSYGFPNKGTHSQTDLLMLPGEKAFFDPLVLDYPATAPPTPLVGPVRRGGEAPCVGCLVSFRQTQGSGDAGLGLGVKGRSCLKVLVEAGKRLVLDASDVKGRREVSPLPGPLAKAARKHGHQLGMHITIGEKALRVTVRAGVPGDVRSHSQDLPITHAQRKRLLEKPLAVLSRGGRHEVIPYVDQPRAPEPDLLRPASPNRWRNPGDHQLYAVYKAAWRLGDAAPASLLALRKTLLAAAARSPEEQCQAAATFEKELPRVRADVRGCKAAPAAVRQALRYLKAGQKSR
jgi:hypothetical protein